MFSVVLVAVAEPPGSQDCASEHKSLSPMSKRIYSSPIIPYWLLANK